MVPIRTHRQRRRRRQRLVQEDRDREGEAGEAREAGEPGPSCSCRAPPASETRAARNGDDVGKRRRRTRRRRAATTSTPATGVVAERGRPTLRRLLSLLIASGTAVVEGWWQPGPGVSWQVQLSGDLDLSLDVDMYDVDLFDASTDEIGELRDRGVIVICSFSAGTFEQDRLDADDFESAWLGEEVEDGTSGERWLNITAEGLLTVMEARLDLAVNKTCDGVDPSNVQVYLEDDAGFNTSANEQIAYNTWLADQAHDRNLSVGLRNDWEQLDELQPSFDWAFSEDCLFQGECEAYKPNFVDAEKAVLDVEYFQFDLAFCDNVTALGLDIIVKELSLDERRCSCQNPSTDIDCDELLTQSPTVAADSSSSWVIATAVGASVFIILASALISLWHRRKAGEGDGGGGGGGGADFDEDVDGLSELRSR